MRDQLSVPRKNRKVLIFWFIIIVLLATNFLTGIPYFNAINTSSVLRGSEYSFLNPSQSLYAKKDLIVNIQPLRDQLTAYEKNKDFTVGIYFEYLPTGASIAVNKDIALWPASLIKIPVAMAAMKKVEEGKWKLSNELVLLDDDKSSEFGTLYQQPSGTKFTIESLMRASLVDSDNTAHFIFLRNLEYEEIEDLYNHLGLEDILESVRSAKQSTQEDNRMTAKRYSVFFRSLYNATYLSPEYSQKFLDILVGNTNHEYLAKTLPEGIPFAHKTGIRKDDNSFADSGIIYLPNRPYLLTVMIQRKKGEAEDKEVKKIMDDISQSVYRYITEYSH